MERLAANHPHVASVVEIGKTFNGTPIKAWCIAPKTDRAARRALVLGGHHAREWISIEVPFRIGERLIEQSKSPEIARILDKIEVWVVPVVNPEGNEFSHREGARLWRKNRRPLSGGNVGVDPNRNYDYRFDAGSNSTTDQAQPIYRGPFAFSEAESTSIRRLVDRNFKCAVSFHSYGQHLRHPVATVSEMRDPRMSAVASATYEMVKRSAAAIEQERHSVYAIAPSGEVSDISGDCVEWLFHARGIAAMTVELPPVEYDDEFSLFKLDNAEIEPIFAENWRGALEVLCAAAF